MASTGPQDFPSLDNTFGAIFIGVVCAAGLWGISTMQTYLYYMTYLMDPTGLKMLVAIVWTLDTVHQALISFTIYHQVIQNYFNPPALNELHPTIWIASLLEILATLLVQSFFLKRIWHLSNRRMILVILPAVFIVGRLVVGLVAVAQAVSQTNLADLEVYSRRLWEWLHGLAMVGDILLASIMVYVLHSSRTGLRQTDNLINRLMLYAINTSAVTALFSIGALVCLLALPRTFIFAVFYYGIGRLYVNSMLAALNARKHLMNQTPTFMEMSLTGDLEGDSQRRTRQLRADVTKQTLQSITDRAFERSSKVGNGLEESGKMRVYINTTHSTCQDPVYISKIEHESEPVDAIV